MWFTEEALQRLRHRTPSPVITPQDLTEIQRKQAAEKAIEDAGKGTCMYCGEEIVKNTTLAVWESEFMLAYCNEASGHRHKPIVRYSATEGVVNAERNDPADSQPVQGEGLRY